MFLLYEYSWIVNIPQLVCNVSTVSTSLMIFACTTCENRLHEQIPYMKYIKCKYKTYK